MRTSDVPQDDTVTLGGWRKALYSVDSRGSYQVTASTGWEAEEAVLVQALDEHARLAADALDRVRCGLCSPIEYYMHHCRMDLAVLASYMGIARWRVKRHFKASIFLSLSADMKTKYSDIFDIDVAEFRSIIDGPL